MPAHNTHPIMNLSFAPSALGYVALVYQQRCLHRVFWSTTMNEVRQSVKSLGGEVHDASPSLAQSMVAWMQQPMDVQRWLDEQNLSLSWQQPEPLSKASTDFQRQVWQALLDIPCTQVRSYQQVAKAIGRANAVRAVANACAANPLPIIVPCHRVVRSNGELGGYALGLERKQYLLQQEGIYAVKQALNR